MINQEQSQNRFRRFAWVSACLSLLTGISHVRAFPSYNLIISIIALFTSIQEEDETILKSTSICAVIGVLSLIADIVFCTTWASEIVEGYSGVIKFTLAVFIFHMFVKAAMIYSGLAVTVSISMKGSSDGTDNSREEGSFSTKSPKRLEVESASDQSFTPASKSAVVTFSSEIEERSYSKNQEHTPYAKGGHIAFSPGISGLVSPGFNIKSGKFDAPDQC